MTGWVLQTARLNIRLAQPADVDLIYRLWTDPRVMAQVGFPQGLRTSPEQIAADLEARGADPLRQLLMVEIRQDLTVIGQCKLGQPDAEGIAETDIKLLPEFWGQGYGVEVKRALVDYLFSHTSCLAVQATPNVDNLASIRMQEAVGGVRVGEAVSQFPASMSDWTTPVHHYIYRVYRPGSKHR